MIIFSIGTAEILWIYHHVPVVPIENMFAEKYDISTFQALISYYV